MSASRLLVALLVGGVLAACGTAAVEVAAPAEVRTQADPSAKPGRD